MEVLNIIEFDSPFGGNIGSMLKMIFCNTEGYSFTLTRKKYSNSSSMTSTKKPMHQMIWTNELCHRIHFTNYSYIFYAILLPEI